MTPKLTFEEYEFFEDELSDRMKYRNETEPGHKPIAYCSWCGEPIYFGERYFYDTGSIYYCDFCLGEGTHEGRSCY